MERGGPRRGDEPPELQQARESVRTGLREIQLTLPRASGDLTRARRYCGPFRLDHLRYENAHRAFVINVGVDLEGWEWSLDRTRRLCQYVSTERVIGLVVLLCCLVLTLAGALRAGRSALLGESSACAFVVASIGCVSVPTLQFSRSFGRLLGCLWATSDGLEEALDTLGNVSEEMRWELVQAIGDRASPGAASEAVPSPTGPDPPRAMLAPSAACDLDKPRGIKVSYGSVFVENTKAEPLYVRIVEGNRPPPNPDPPGGDSGAKGTLRLVAGGFEYRGHFRELGGNARKVLEQLLLSRWRTVSAADLKKTVWKDESALSYPQPAKDAVHDLRVALRAALKATGTEAIKDPVPCIDRGESLTWKLEMP